jgi:hypothetical protein
VIEKAREVYENDRRAGMASVAILLDPPIKKNDRNLSIHIACR